MDPLPGKLKKLSGGKILDVATGFGDFLEFLTDSFEDFNEAVGIDSSDAVIEAVRKRGYDGLQFETMDAGD